MKVFLIPHLPLLNGCYAINLFGCVLSKTKLSEEDLNHEAIHSLQQRELLYVGFYLWYLIEWLIRFLIYRNKAKAYLNVSFEREAYSHQKDLRYRLHRRSYSWLKYCSRR